MRKTISLSWGDGQEVTKTYATGGAKAALVRRLIPGIGRVFVAFGELTGADDWIPLHEGDVFFHPFDELHVRVVDIPTTTRAIGGTQYGPITTGLPGVAPHLVIEATDCPAELPERPARPSAIPPLEIWLSDTTATQDYNLPWKAVELHSFHVRFSGSSTGGRVTVYGQSFSAVGTKIEMDADGDYFAVYPSPLLVVGGDANVRVQASLFTAGTDEAVSVIIQATPADYEL